MMSTAQIVDLPYKLVALTIPKRMQGNASSHPMIETVGYQIAFSVILPASCLFSHH
jgi:hypothetical protein